jgi:hypothetical protein
MTFDSTTVTRIDNAEVKSAYLSDELGYYPAFQRHIEVLVKLRDTGQCYREAYFHCLFAVEIFLKDIFCTLRFRALGGFNQITQGAAFTQFPDAIRKKMSDSLRAFSFSHDLRRIAECVQDFCPNLKNDADFQILLGLLPKNPKWPEQRYDDPATHVHVDFKVELEKLEGALTGVRERAFRGFR